MKLQEESKRLTENLAVAVRVREAGCWTGWTQLLLKCSPDPASAYNLPESLKDLCYPQRSVDWQTVSVLRGMPIMQGGGWHVSALLFNLHLPHVAWCSSVRPSSAGLVTKLKEVDEEDVREGTYTVFTVQNLRNVLEYLVTCTSNLFLFLENYSLCTWVLKHLLLFSLSALPKTWRTSLSCSTMPRRLFSTRQDPCTALRRRRWDPSQQILVMTVSSVSLTAETQAKLDMWAGTSPHVL